MQYKMKKISKRRLIDLSFIICHLTFNAALLTSCSIMQEDRSDCPECRNPLHITLRYDYNTMRADMFHDHVEQATVYLVNPQTNAVIDFQTAANTVSDKPLREKSFGFNFEGLAPGNYRLYATGRSAADAAIGITAPAIGEAISRIQFTIPSDAAGNVPTQRLDTVWNTLQPVDIVIPEREPTEATIPLMRLTNDLNIMIFKRDTPTDNGHKMYDVRVTDESPAIDFDNQPTAERIGSPMMTYRPFAAWTTETTADDGSGVSTIVERNAHYDLTLSRLVGHSDARRNARLIITNTTDGQEIVNIDLCHYLALARNAYEIYNYSTQEYLDREYDYRLDFGIEGNTWKYMTISINVLSWSIRIQNEEL